MATYAVGDIQGCYDELRRALDRVQFDPKQDQLWCVGDLVNRGPKSLEVLRFIKSLGHAAISVLGNHDLHLLAIASGNKHKSARTLQPILEANDRDELISWLQYRPLLHWDQNLGYAMLHAGLPPEWDMPTAVRLAQEVENVLRSEAAQDYFAHMYGDKPVQWNENLRGINRLRFITNCFTRLRFCNTDGVLSLEDKGKPGTQTDPQYQPWFSHQHRASLDTRIIFGHWSTLGYVHKHNVWALDTGCLWGGSLTLFDLAKAKAQHFPCPGQESPEKFA
jgi:bis(5'-nucleosyl)-tetraphosphatase (symmetrical)